MPRIISLAACICVALSALASPARTGQGPQAGLKARPRHTVADGVSALWSPDNRTLAMAVAGKGLLLYDAATGTARAEIKHQAAPAPKAGISFTPDGRALVIQDGRVSL